jgi:hypothetical protein
MIRDDVIDGAPSFSGPTSRAHRFARHHGHKMVDGLAFAFVRYRLTSGLHAVVG